MQLERSPCYSARAFSRFIGFSEEPRYRDNSNDLQTDGGGRREVAEDKRGSSGAALVRAGAKFVNGELVERNEEKDAA